MLLVKFLQNQQVWGDDLKLVLKKFLLVSAPIMRMKCTCEVANDR